jgi:hypothetical protein
MGIVPMGIGMLHLRITMFMGMLKGGQQHTYLRRRYCTESCNQSVL